MKKIITLQIVIVTMLMFGMGSEQGHFDLNEKDGAITVIDFSLGDIDTRTIGENTRIIASDAGKTVDLGMPELPIFTTFFQMQPGIDYEVTYEVLTSRILKNITVFPTQDIEQEEDNDDISLKNYDYYNSEYVYPEKNLTMSEPMIMRQLEVVTISLVPFRYFAGTKQLEIFEEVNIQIVEAGDRPLSNASNMPPSRTFEQIYSSLIVNYEPSNRNEDYQQPAVLYICGGGNGGAIDNPAFTQLVEWRHKRGYVVYSAHTGETGSSNNSIKNYIEDAYENFDPPPEIVGLVGDTGGSYIVPNWSMNSGDSDHPYSQLDGGDLLPEVLIGRISVENSGDLFNVVNKTIAYEKATYMGNNWFEKAALCGDWSASGLSAVITNEYIQNIMENHGMEDVRINAGGGNYSNWMAGQLDEGMLYMNYRGYLGTSGFDSGDIYGANNGYMTPFVCFITCSTGNFGSSWGCIVEDFLRAGSISSPKGAIGAVGTATSSTHTAPNNIVDMGIFDGIFAKGVETTGGALASGKLALYNTYPGNPSNVVGKFTGWNNLMGDPAIHLWTDTPAIITADFPEEIGLGSNFIDVYLTYEDGEPVYEAFVTLVTDDDEIFISAFTNENGIATLALPLTYTGDVDVTITKRNHKPVEDTFEIISDGPSVNIIADDISLDDSTGNGDGMWNPDETIILTIPLQNYGSETANNVTAQITAGSELAIINSDIFEYGSINSEESVIGTFELYLSPSAIFNEELDLRIFISDDAENSWSSLINITVQAGKLTIDGYDVVTGELSPGLTKNIVIDLSNDGMIPVNGITGELFLIGSLLTFDNGLATWDDIPAGQTRGSTEFTVTASEDLVRGTILPVELHLYNDDGYDRTEIVHIQVGEVTVLDPLGPDQYGYYIYDSGDLGYGLAMPYDWIEIDPDYGGDGTSLNMNDSGTGNPESQQNAHVDLPFTFTFYGIDYDDITISTNGWIAFGDNELESFRNYPIPGAGGPSPMVAVFWDDLKTSDGGQVYKYINEEDEYVIIEWSEMRTAVSPTNQVETFQIILFNSLTPTGDDEMKLQYKEFNNTSVGNIGSYPAVHGCYSTVGIENHLSNDGLQYTFHDNYPVAAMELSDHTALTITTRQPLVLMKGDVNQDGLINILDIIMVVNDIINLEDLGPMESYIADMDDSGNITILDVIIMINNILDE